MVVVSGPRSDWILTPAAPQRFRETLIEQVRAATGITSTTPPLRCGWLDHVAAVDGGIRVLLGLGLLLASFGLASDVVRQGAAQRDTLLATLILGFNGALSIPLAARAVGAARLLLVTALVAQSFAVLV